MLRSLFVSIWRPIRSELFFIAPFRSQKIMRRHALTEENEMKETKLLNFSTFDAVFVSGIGNGNASEFDKICAHSHRPAEPQPHSVSKESKHWRRQLDSYIRFNTWVLNTPAVVVDSTAWNGLNIEHKCLTTVVPWVQYRGPSWYPVHRKVHNGLFAYMCYIRTIRNQMRWSKCAMSSGGEATVCVDACALHCGWLHAMLHALKWWAHASISKPPVETCWYAGNVTSVYLDRYFV